MDAGLQRRSSAREAPGALDGVTVCDFSWVGAGPRATKELADHGATVLKIESRHRLDPSRRTPPFQGPASPDSSAFFVMSNTSKRSVALNLADPRGVEIARRLALASDMVVENFGKGFMERIGLDYASLSAERSDLVMASVSIAGRTGPMSGFRGYGNSAAATSGQALLTGFPGGPPHLTNYAFGDVATPLYAAIAMMGALEYRRRTGRGVYVDVAQLESMMQLLSPALLEHSATGRVPEPMGNRSTWCAPHGVFACAGEDAWVAVAVETDEQWRDLCVCVGRRELATDPRFATVEARLANVGDAEAVVEAWTRTRTPEEAAEALLAVDVPAAKVRDGREVSEDPQLAHRRLAERIEHPVMGPVRHVAPAFSLSETPARVRAAPVLGADTRDVLTGLLGMAEAEVEALERDGVLA